MPVKTSVKISSLGYVIVYVKDTKASVPFYRDTLGIKVKSEEDGWVEFETGSTVLALHSDKELKANRDTKGQPVPVFNVDDFKATVEALKASGVKLHKEPQQVCEAGPGKVGMCVEFNDTDGNCLSVFGFVSK